MCSSRAPAARRRSAWSPAVQHDDGVHPLAPVLVGHADDRAGRHGGVLGERVLDLGRVHVLAAGDDHVLDAVDDEDVAVARPCSRRRRCASSRRAAPPRSPPACSSSRASRCRRGRRSRPTVPRGTSWSCSSTIRTSTCGAARPAERRRDGSSWSAGSEQRGDRRQLGHAVGLDEVAVPGRRFARPVEHAPRRSARRRR